MTPRKEKITANQIEHALKRTAGNITAAAQGLGMSRQHLHLRISQSASLQQTLQDEREALVDIAESALRKNVLEGDMTAIIWTLKASPSAKMRGWGERQELTGANGGPVKTQQVFEHENVVAAITGRSDRNRGESS